MSSSRIQPEREGGRDVKMKLIMRNVAEIGDSKVRTTYPKKKTK